MRVSVRAFVPLVLGACSQPRAPDSATPKATHAPAAPLVSATQIADVKHCEVVGDSKAGAVEYQMVVSAAGHVERVEASQTPVSAAVINCSVQRIRAWSFTATGKVERVTFRVAFDARAAPVPQAGPPGSKASLKAQIGDRTSPLQHCYNKSLRSNPTIQGEAKYKIVIGVDGKVRAVEASHAPSLPTEMIECTKEKIRRWVFPMNGAATGADVSFTVMFQGR